MRCVCREYLTFKGYYLNLLYQIWFGFIFIYYKSLKRTFKTGFWVQKMHSIKKNRTVSWGLLSDLLLNVSPSFSRYNMVFCTPSCLFYPRGRIEFCRRGRKKFRALRARFCPPYFFLPPLNSFSAPAKKNPAHASASA